MRTPFVLVGVILGVCLARTSFDKPGVVHDVPPASGFLDKEKSFRGGYDFGDAVPGRARRPQPNYDNWKYGGVNFFEHEQIYLEGNLVLDWQPRTGDYRIFELVRHPDDQCPVIPEKAIAEGSWPTRKLHKLLYVGCGGSAPGGKVLDYNPAEGTYELWRFNHRVTGPVDPFIEILAKGFRREVLNFNPVYLGEDELFFYEKNTGGFSIYYINNQLPSHIDPIQPPEPIVYGKLQGLHEQQVYIGKNQIIDYDPMFGRYWIYGYDRTSINNSNPFTGPLASGGIEKGMTIAYLAEEQLLMHDPETGLYAVFEFNRPAPLDEYSEAQKTAEERQAETYKIYNMEGPPFALKKPAGNFGFGSLVDGNHCTGAGTCRNCLKRPGCGWCSTLKECLRGSTIEPCSTNCTTWMPVFCEAEPCSSHLSCTECLSDPFCGFCGTDRQCTEGTHQGPLFGSCSEWHKEACPVYEEGVDIPAPCIDKGLISL